MTFAEQLDQVTAIKSREGQFSGVVLIKRDGNMSFRVPSGEEHRSE
jgi:hypothetical protein